MKVSLKGHFLHWERMLRDSRYRRQALERHRLQKFPRYTPTVTDLLGTPFEMVDAASFLEMHEQIWDHENYRFVSRSERPYILDCGANIGLSVLFFKRHYPDCNLVAFEPADEIFQVLERNVRQAGLTGVELVHKAVWTSATTLPFFSEGSYGGRVARNRDPQSRTIETVRLRDYLDRHVDLLKLDIEQGETHVLEDCMDRLGNVDHLFVEYHGEDGTPQELSRLVSILSEARFRLNVHAGNDSKKPFVARKVNMGNDLQLEVFAFRDSPFLQPPTGNPL